MSHNAESEKIEREVSNKIDKSNNATEERSEEEEIPILESQEEEKKTQNKEDLKERNQLKTDSTKSSQHETDTTKSSQKQEEFTESNQEKENFTEISEQNKKSEDSNQNKVDFKETNQEKKDTSESSQEETDSIILNQNQIESKESEQQIVDTTKTSHQKLDSITSSQNQVQIVVRDQQYNDQERGQSKEKQRSVRQFVIWTVAEFFDTNPKYLTNVRGIGNFLNIVLSLTILILLSLVCQLRPFTHGSSEGFYCKPPETFLFTVACCSFLTAILYFFCCILSKSTDFLLFQSAFEVNYFVLYFILFITAGMVVVVNEMNWDPSELWHYDDESPHIQAAATIGLINSVIYALSAVWYFMNHCKQEGSLIEVPEW